MPKLVYYIGSALLWLLTASGSAWWVFTVFEVHEVQWALIASTGVLIPVLFAAYVLQRIRLCTYIIGATIDAKLRQRD